MTLASISKMLVPDASSAHGRYRTAPKVGGWLSGGARTRPGSQQPQGAAGRRCSIGSVCVRRGLWHSGCRCSVAGCAWLGACRVLQGGGLWLERPCRSGNIIRTMTGSWVRGSDVASRRLTRGRRRHCPMPTIRARGLRCAMWGSKLLGRQQGSPRSLLSDVLPPPHL